MGNVFEKFDLTGKVAIVTGGSGLLGNQFCRTLVQANCKVVVADIMGDDAEALVKCPHCERTFLPDRLEIHLRSCFKDKPLKPLPKKKVEEYKGILDKLTNGPVLVISI